MCVRNPCFSHWHTHTRHTYRVHPTNERKSNEKQWADRAQTHTFAYYYLFDLNVERNSVKSKKEGTREPSNWLLIPGRINAPRRWMFRSFWHTYQRNKTLYSRRFFQISILHNQIYIFLSQFRWTFYTFLSLFIMPMAYCQPSVSFHFEFMQFPTEVVRSEHICFRTPSIACCNRQQ